MARIKQTESGTQIWLSARDTYEWAHRPNALWPCSHISGFKLYAAFDASGDLVDLSIDDGRHDEDCTSDEFNAIVSDHLRERFGSHPAIRS